MAVPFALRPLAADLDHSDATAELILRHLVAAKLHKRGKRGVSPEHEPVELALYIFAAAGSQPIETGRVVPGFAAAEYRRSPGAGEDQRPRLGPGNLLSLVAAMIEWCAHRAEAEVEAPDQAATFDPDRRFPHVLVFKLAPLAVELVWYGGNGQVERTDVYAPRFSDLVTEPTPADQPWRGLNITRATIIPFSVIRTAGRVWRDTLRRRNRSTKELQQ